MKSLMRTSVMGLLMVLVFGTSFALGQFPFFQNPNVGRSAPDFTLATLKGKDVNMTEYRNGKDAVIFFWATWCPHCRAALKELNEDFEEFEKKGIKLIVVDIGEDEDHVRSYAQSKKLKMDIFLDKESSLAEPYGIIGVPTFFFVTKEGVVKAVKHSLPDNFEELFAKK